MPIIFNRYIYIRGGSTMEYLLMDQEQQDKFNSLFKFSKKEEFKYSKDPDGNEYEYTIMDLANMQKEN